jgi:hypothetical protein
VLDQRSCQFTAARRPPQRTNLDTDITAFDKQKLPPEPRIGKVRDELAARVLRGRAMDDTPS